MKAYLSRLNPAERRFVIGVALLLFVVVNFFFVLPHFSDWGTLRGRLENARTKLRNYETAIEHTNVLSAQIRRLGSEEANVPLEDQANQFFQVIQRQAAESGVGFQGNSRMNMSTNQFFIEQELPINIQAGEKQLVDFLYKLGSGNSLIRVKSLSVRPEPNHYQLSANITLVASYQKKPQTRSRSAAPATAPATRTAAPRTAAPAARPGAPKLPTPSNKK